jgi:hypothetical protein
MPGGHIDPGETPDHAARRELFEETGIRVPISALKLVRVEKRPRGDYYFYRVDLPVKPPVVLSFEHDTYMWVDETKHNPDWLKKYLGGKDTSKMTAEQKAKEAKVGAASAIGMKAGIQVGKQVLKKRAAEEAAKQAAKTGAKIGAKQAIKAGGAGVPVVGWAVTGAFMTYDAAPEAWAVGKEGIEKGKKALSEVLAAKGAKEKAKAFGRGYVEAAKHGAAGVGRVGAAAIVGSDVVKMGREAYEEKQMKKNGAADAASKIVIRAGRRAARTGAAKAASGKFEKVMSRTASAAKAATVGVLAITGGAKVVASEGREVADIARGRKRMQTVSNPSDIAANVAEINRYLKSMPSGWEANLDSNRMKLQAAGAEADQIPPARPNAHSVLLALNLNNRGDVSSEAAAGQEPASGNTVPEDVREAAMEGVRLSHKNNYGGYDFIGVARAIQLAISPRISDAALNRMRMYFNSKTKQDRLSDQYVQKHGKRYWAWMNWGGDPGAVWSKSKRFRELVGGSMQNHRNPAPGITMTQWYADVANEDWANWDLNRAGIMHYSPRGIPTSKSIVRRNPLAKADKDVAAILFEDKDAPLTSNLLVILFDRSDWEDYKKTADEDALDRSIIGFLEAGNKRKAKWNDPDQPEAAQVSGAISLPGYGPLLYATALKLYEQRKKVKLYPDRTLSAHAVRFWSRFPNGYMEPLDNSTYEKTFGVRPTSVTGYAAKLSAKEKETLSLRAADLFLDIYNDMDSDSGEMTKFLPRDERNFAAPMRAGANPFNHFPRRGRR